MSLTTRVLIGLVAGLAIGALASASGNPAVLAVVSGLQPIGELWVNAIRMTVLPLVVAMLIGGIASVTDLRSVGRLGARTTLLMLGMLIGSALVAVILGPLFFSLISIDATSVAGLRLSAAPPDDVVRQLPTFRQWLVSLVPTNPFRAAADGALLPLVVFSVFFALAIVKLPAEPKRVLLGVFSAIGEAMLILVRWIILAAPVGVFILALGLIARTGAGAAGALGLYVALTCALFLIATLLLYPVAVLAGRVRFTSFASAIAPAQAVALSTRSSLASLPAMVDVADKRLFLPTTVSGFVLPVAVSTFKMSTPITHISGALFLSQLYGVPLSAIQILTIASLGVVLSLSAPGVPSASLYIMVPVLVSLGIPAEGVGILIALDVLPDVVKTIMNVTADLTAATVISAHSGDDVAVAVNRPTEISLVS
jgi:Na+/H+-dicarboxylate symporter